MSTSPRPPDAPHDAQITLRLCGSPHWQAGHGTPAALGRLDAALLALVVCSDEGFPRDRAAAWLWPTVPLKTAQTNLRQHIFKLRQASGHALLQTGPVLRLAPGVVTDITRAAHPQGELLGGFDYGDLEALDEWVRAARERQRHARADALAARAAAHEARGAVAAAIDDCTQLLALAPQQERAWRQLMRLHYLRGDRSAAIATFERFEQQVCRELGLVPAAETLSLLATIERSESRAPAGRGPLPAALVLPPRLVGRDAAWRAAQAAWDAGRAVLVLGEGGIGKSRLLAELVGAWPSSQGVLQLAARPGDAAAPYTTLVPLLSQALQHGGAAALAASERAELARLLPALGEPAAGSARQTALWQAAEALLQACHAQGVGLLVLDDLHHADLASLEFLRWAMAAPALAGLRWLFAARPDEPGAAAEALQHWLGDSLRVEPVRLERFDAQQLSELLQTLALPGWSADDDAAPAALLRHAGGHPFFTLETLKAQWLQPETAAGLPLPPAVGAMLARRIRQCSPLAVQLLQLLALVPGLLRPERAAELLACDGAALAAAWGELEAAQLARGAWPAHDLVREQVLASWPAAARAPLARRAAAALQAEGSVPAARLVDLWRQAQAPREAALALQSLAQDAGRAGRLAEREGLSLQAAAAWREAAEPGAAFDAELRAAEDGLLLHGSPATLARCNELLPRADSALRRAGVYTLQANAQLNDARYAEALASADAAVHAAPPGSALAQDAATLHGRALALTGQADAAVPVLQRAAAQADAAQDGARALAAHGALAHALQVAGQFGAAAQHQAQARAIALQLGDSTEVAQTSCNLATLRATLGQPQAALHSARDADQRLQALGAADAHWVFNRITLARCAAHEGALAEALQALAEAEARAEAVGPSMATMLRIQRYGVLDWLGQADPSLLPQAPDQLATLSGLAQAGVLLALHRRLREQGADLAQREPVEVQLRHLATAQPALREDPVLAREWCRVDAAPQAVERLTALAERARAAGAPGLARSLDLVRLARLVEWRPRQAPALALTLLPQMHEGLHPATLPPQAWATLAAALPAGPQQDRAWASARAWLDGARLPPEVARVDFLRRHAAWLQPAPVR